MSTEPFSEGEVSLKNIAHQLDMESILDCLSLM